MRKGRGLGEGWRRGLGEGWGRGGGWVRDEGGGRVRDRGGGLMWEKCISNLSSQPVFAGMHLCIGETFSCNSMQFSVFFAMPCN
jgi:hypothetical protein